MKFFENVPFNQVFHFNTDPNHISDSGVDEITNYANKENLRNLLWRYILPGDYDPYDYRKDRLPPFPSDWDWVAKSEGKLIDGKKYSGRFTRRYSSYVWEKQGIKLPISWIERMGNIVSSHSEKNAGYKFDFTDDLRSWKSGEFGDDGSCFWQSRDSARTIMTKHGVCAVRFYQPDTGKGVARAWITPDVPEEGMAIVWNGYGFSGDPTRIISRILAEYFSQLGHYREISLFNNKSGAGTVYINGERGYVIAQEEKSKKFSTFDFGWNEQIRGTCCHCNNPIYDNDPYRVESGSYWCQDCFDDNFSICDICDDYFQDENEHIIEQRMSNGQWNDLHVCEHCLETRSLSCGNCGRHTFENSITFVDGISLHYCSECAEDFIGECDICHISTANENLTEHESTEQVLCEVCFADIIESETS